MDVASKRSIWSQSSPADVGTACISFNSDNTHVVLGFASGGVQFHEVTRLGTGLYRRTPDIHTTRSWPDSDIRAFSPDGQRLFLQSGRIYDSEADAYATPTVASRTDHLLASKISIDQAIYFPDGERIAFTIKNNYDIFVWDPSSTDTSLQRAVGHTATISCFSISQTGTCLASGSYDGTARIWDARSSDCSETPCCLVQLDHNDAVTSVALDPNGRRLASAMKNRDEVLLWDLGTQTILKQFDTSYHAAYSPSGTHLATLTPDGLCIWSADTLQLARHIVYDRCEQSSFSNDGTRIVAGGRDSGVRSIRIFSVLTGQCLNRWNHKSGGPSSARISWSADDQTLLILSDGDFDTARTYLLGETTLWHTYCAKLTITVGWVKDSHGGLLLWIPDQHREMVRQNLLSRFRPNHLPERAPFVDSKAVCRVAGKDWAENFEVLFQ